MGLWTQLGGVLKLARDAVPETVGTVVGHAILQPGMERMSEKFFAASRREELVRLIWGEEMEEEHSRNLRRRHREATQAGPGVEDRFTRLLSTVLVNDPKKKKKEGEGGERAAGFAAQKAKSGGGTNENHDILKRLNGLEDEEFDQVLIMLEDDRVAQFLGKVSAKIAPLLALCRQEFVDADATLEGVGRGLRNEGSWWKC